ncbi:ribosomal protection-like ABC-F family protein [Bacillus sp. 03113]|uniref:ribosomal protection-like ABC-F family protein n=1 Tax=Bacillus sp. 03113 TaxID=2578211 RepID=UPI001142833C|nr:ABC-F type ribosomal protection protein [Bacillus sp. 03113]
MLLLEANKIEKSYGDRLVIKVEQLRVYHGDRIGIVGKNGEGKSTLLKMLVNELEPDQGTVQLFGPVTFIPQLEILEMDEIGTKERNHWGVPLEKGDLLSGGEVTRKKIATAFSSDAMLIFADEPTSHLDVQGIEQFEKEVKEFDGGIVIISHDQELLNQVCKTIWEVDNGALTIFEGNYSDYLAQKQQMKERQLYEYEQYIKEKQRLEQAAIERSQKSKSLKKTPSRMGNSEARLHKRSVGKQKAKLDKGVKAIQSRINQLEKKEKPKTEADIIFDLNFFKQIHNKTVLSFQNVSAKVSNRLLFSELNTSIKPGSKIAVTGKNGVGKSTLLKMISSGHKGISMAKPVTIGFFHQQLENLDENKTILENVKETSNYEEHFIRTVLSRLLIKREEIHKKVYQLSGGERVKTALVKVFLGDYNVLLLDEPTNYLDLQTKEALQKVLKAYPGTIIFVTHDRHFINELATHVIVIEKNRGCLKDIEKIVKIEKTITKQAEETDLLVIEMELTETISKLSFVSSEEEKQLLEEKYKDLLMKKKRLRA